MAERSEAGRGRLEDDYMQTHLQLTENARSLRRNMTDAEKKLWYRFLRQYPVRFRKQHVIEQYIVDFYCPKAKLAIELDGGQHYEDAALKKDQDRTKALNEHNIHILRYTNIEVLKHFEGVCTEIHEWVISRV